MKYTLEWWRIRRFLDIEIERLEKQPDIDYNTGKLMAFLQIKGRYFLTEDEARDVEAVRREMFG